MDVWREGASWNTFSRLPSMLPTWSTHHFNGLVSPSFSVPAETFEQMLFDLSLSLTTVWSPHGVTVTRVGVDICGGVVLLLEKKIFSAVLIFLKDMDSLDVAEDQVRGEKLIVNKFKARAKFDQIGAQTNVCWYLLTIFELEARISI